MGSRLPSTATIVLLSAARALAAGSTCLFCVSIDESPAPPPDEGPPFSAHASRNRALLPGQICGIVGSYIGAVLILGTLLLTVGRRLRRQALTSHAKPMEMVKPSNRTFDPSPISPASTQRSWYSPRRLGKKKSVPNSIRSGFSNPASPGMDSVASFDHSVIEADKQKRQDEMERLYAAVMAQDDRKSAGQTSTVEIPQVEPPQYSKKAPPRLLTSAPALAHLRIPASNPVSPRSPTTPHTPKSPIRAIYPPDSPMPPMPNSPTSPIRAEYPTTPLTPGGHTYFNQPQSPLRANRDSRTSSFGSTGSAGSGGKKLKKSLRNLRISAPIMKNDNSDGARTPLSPRFYTDPGIPPEPPTARTMDSNYPPTTPGTAKSWRYGEDDDNEELDTIQDLPRPAPQRMSSYTYNNTPQQLTNTASTRPDPTTNNRSPQKQPIASVNNTLPFRQYQTQNNPQNISSSYQPHLQSVPLQSPGFNTKTTYLERSRDMLGAPRTGLATPYSPYMPFTPLTPVTPHLTSRRERKQREREERTARTAIVEEEAVADDGELWSSGY